MPFKRLIHLCPSKVKIPVFEDRIVPDGKVNGIFYHLVELIVKNRRIIIGLYLVATFIGLYIVVIQ